MVFVLEILVLLGVKHTINEYNFDCILILQTTVLIDSTILIIKENVLYNRQKLVLTLKVLHKRL